MSGKRESGPKAQKEALRESEERFRAIFETSMVGLYRTTPDGRILMANPALVQMLGYSSFEELAHRNLEEEGYETEYPRSAFKERIESEGQIVGLESAWVRCDGTTVFVRESARVVRDDAGDTLYYEGTVEDIGERKRAEDALRKAHDELDRRVEARTAELTASNRQLRQEIAERKSAEEALRESERRLNQAQRVAHVANYERDFQTGEGYWSDEQFRLFGYEPGEVPSSHELFRKHIHSDDVAMVTEAIREGLAEGKGFDIGCRYIPRGGEVRYAHIISNVKLDDDGKPRWMHGTFQDVTEHRAAEEALRESTRLLETIFDHTHMLLAYMDPHFNFVRVNRTYAEADQREPSFFPGKNHFDLYPGEENEVIFRQVVETGEPHVVYAKPFEHAEHPERGITYWDWTLVPTKDDTGTVTGLVFTLADVTERKRAEKDLWESDERYRDLVESIDDVIYSLDSDGVLTYVSTSIEALGYSASDLVGHTLAEFLVPEDLQTAGETFQRLLAGQAVGENEYRILTKSREVRWIRVSGRPVLTDDRVVGIRGALSDITERKQAEQALWESEERYRTLFEALPVGVRLATLDGQVLAANSAMCRMMGYSEAELQDISLPGTYLDPEDRVELLQRMERSGSVGQFEVSLTCKDGTAFHASLTATPSIVGGRKVILTVVQDVTERKRAEQELLQAKEAAEAASREAEERRLEAERRRRIAESLAGVMTVLNSSQTLDEVLDYITSQAGRLLDNQAGAIYKLEDDGKLSVRAAQGLLLGYADGVEIPIGQHALEQAMASGKAVAVPRLGTHLADEDLPPGDTQSEALARTWADLYQAFLAVPITVGDQPYGGIGLYYTEPREFPEEEVRLATIFGDQVALAIENARLRDQVREAATIAERERLAGDLHDAVTQTLFSAGLIAETLPRIWERDPERAQDGLAELRRLTQGALAEMRTLLLELRPAALTERSLGELLTQLTTALTSRSRVPIDLTVEGDSFLPPGTQIALYRIAQEALNNVAKHAAATEVSIRLRCDPGRVALSIQDDGRGFDPADALPDQLGLGIMQERAESIGARLEIRTRPGDGTRVTVRWSESSGKELNG